MLEKLPLVSGPKEDAFEGAFSFVLPDDAARGPRPLPSVYMGKTLFFADRRPEAVAEMFAWIANALQRSLAESTYTLHAVRLGPVYGLYGRDFFNRAAFRRSLSKAGAEFAPVPFTTLSGTSFRCESWGRFDPRFVIMPNPDASEPGPIATTRAELAFALATFRIGGPDLQELQTLIDISKEMQGLSGEDPAALMGAVQANSNGG